MSEKLYIQTKIEFPIDTELDNWFRNQADMILSASFDPLSTGKPLLNLIKEFNKKCEKGEEAAAKKYLIDYLSKKISNLKEKGSDIAAEELKIFMKHVVINPD